MRVLVQRVRQASVTVEGAVRGEIGAGLLLLVGVEDADGPEDIVWLTRKLSQLRIFNDEAGVMNRSVLDCGGEVLAVSQFTLFASTKKGTGRRTRGPRGRSGPNRCSINSSPRWRKPWASQCQPGCSAPICRWRWSMTAR